MIDNSQLNIFTYLARVCLCSFFLLLSIVILVYLEEVQFTLFMPQDAKINDSKNKGLLLSRWLTAILHKADSCKVKTTSLYMTATLDEAPQTTSFRSHDSRTLAFLPKAYSGSHCHPNHCSTASSSVLTSLLSEILNWI